MNLHGIVSGAIGEVNPFVACSLQGSLPPTTGPTGKRTPAYADPVTISCQIQPISWRDMRQLDGINIEGERRSLYIKGQWQGVLRPGEKGGDLITFPDASVWLVVLVSEQWPDWCHVIVTRQNQ